jgi:hypothetical protein
MATTVHTTAERVALMLEGMGPAVDAQVLPELSAQAQAIAQTMRQRAPKFQTVLANSIHVEQPSLYVRVIAPGVDYAQAQEDGIAPGGKGLPRFFDPASAPIVAWLQSKLGVLPAKRAKKKRQTFELELRDRYEGLAWHIRHKGMKGTPFVRPTFEAHAGKVAAALKAAVVRGLEPRGGAA